MSQFKTALPMLGMIASIMLAAIIALASILPSAATTPMAGNDKLYHVLAYMALAGALLVWLGPQALLRAFILAFAYGALMELAQWLAPTGREASGLDMVANALGAGFGIMAGRFSLRLIDRL